MSTTITFNGTNYTIPQTGNRGWGTNVTAYMVAISNGTLQKTGGNFTLTGAVNFGANYGLLAAYFSTRTALPSTAGLLRLAVTDLIGWRNNANSGNLVLGVNGSDQLTFNGSTFVSGGISSLTGDVTGTGPGAAVTTVEAIGGVAVGTPTGTGNIVFSNSPVLVTPDLGTPSALVGTNITGTAAGLTAGNVTTNANLVGPVTSVGNTTTIQPTSITNAMLAESIAIASGGTGQITANAGFNALSPMTTGGDLIYGGASGVGTRLANGAAGQVLQSNGTTLAPTWEDAAATGVTSVGMTVPAFLSVAGSPITGAGSFAVTLSGTALPIANGGTGNVSAAAAFDGLSPMTTGGDLIYGGAAGTGTRLANGSAGQVLQSNGTTLAPSWEDPAAASPLTTKGDIYGFSTVNDRFPVGTDGQLIRADSTQTLGLGWVTPSSTSTAATIVSRDASGNTVLTNLKLSFQTIATAAGTTTLTVASPAITEFTGTTTQTVELPTTSIVAGMQYTIKNNSTGIVTAQSSGGNVIQAMPSGTQLVVTALVATPTTAAHWSAVMSVNGLILGTAPTISKATATGTASGTGGFVSGTYTVPSGCSWIEVEMTGGGGGGSGSGNNATAGNGGTGGNTIFGTCTASGGGGGGALGVGNFGGTGGAATLGTGFTGTALVGGGGASGSGNGNTQYILGGSGGNNPLGGAGQGRFSSGGGSESVGAANTGSGGSGPGNNSQTIFSGSGGGAAGYIKAIYVPTAGQTFSYSVALGGIAGTTGTGTSAAAGFEGGTGYIKVTEYYPNTAVSSVLVGVAPTVSKATAAGTATGTGGFNQVGIYTVPNGVQWIEVEILGAGGGGGGSSGANATDGGLGGTGGTTTFGTSSCTGGTGGLGSSGTGGTGGTPTLGSGFTGTSTSGGTGGSAFATGTGSQNGQGGMGAASPLGGAGGNASATNTGRTAAANTGSGGGGGGTPGNATAFGGGGGGAGAYIKAVYIPTAGQAISFSVGAFGLAGNAGSGGAAGGAGSLGYIKVIEHYTNLAVGTQAAIPAGQVMAGPSSGAAAQPNFRSLAVGDLNPLTVAMAANNQTPTGTLTTAFNVVKFATVATDLTSSYDSGTGLFTVPAGRAGLYFISSTVEILATYTAAQNSRVGIFKGGTGGTSISFGAYQAIGSETGTVKTITAIGIVNCAVGDTIAPYAYSSGSTVSYSNFYTGSSLSIFRIM
jgi:hypothetical protein